MKQTFHIFWEQSDFRGDNPQVSLFSCDMREIWPERPYGGTVEVELGDPPTKEILTAAAVSKYKLKIGDHAAAITVLEGKIQSLLCIEHKPEEA